MDNSLNIISYWMQAATCLLLTIVACSMLWKKSFRKEPLFPALLLVLLLLAANGNSAWNNWKGSPSPPGNDAYPQSLLEWLLYAWMARSLLAHNSRRYMDYLLIAGVSVSITTYIAAPVQDRSSILASLHTYGAGVFAVFLIAQLGRKKNMYILQLPLFWMAVGMVFYATMYAMTQLLLPQIEWTTPTSSEWQLLALFFNLIRFVLYGVAAWVKEAKA